MSSMRNACFDVPNPGGGTRLLAKNGDTKRT